MKLRLVILGAALILTIGCSRDGLVTHDVTGVITLDGKPIANAGVLFMPADGPTASGTTNSEGRYSLMTGERTGAVPGYHKVVITLMKTSGIEVRPDGTSGAVSPGGVQVKYIVPKKYSNAETSGLTAQVNPDNAEHNFALVSK